MNIEDVSDEQTNVLRVLLTFCFCCPYRLNKKLSHVLCFCVCACVGRRGSGGAGHLTSACEPCSSSDCLPSTPASRSTPAEHARHLRLLTSAFGLWARWVSLGRRGVSGGGGWGVRIVAGWTILPCTIVFKKNHSHSFFSFSLEPAHINTWKPLNI